MEDTDGIAPSLFPVSVTKDSGPGPQTTSGDLTIEGAVTTVGDVIVADATGGDLTAEGAVIVQGIMTDSGFMSSELALQISQAGGQVVAATETLTTDSQPMIVHSAVLGTSSEVMAPDNQLAETIVQDLPGDNVTSATAEGPNVQEEDGFQQEGVVSQDTVEGGVRVDSAPDQIQSHGVSDGDEVLNEVHQIPDDKLLMFVQEDTNVVMEAQDKAAEDDSFPEAPPKQETEPGNKDVSQGTKEVIFVCIHGQSFRCKPQAGIPVGDPVMEVPEDSCACSKIKKSQAASKKPPRLAVVKGGKLARKLRNRKQLYTCDMCESRFSNKGALDLHMAAHAEDNEEDKESEEEMETIQETTGKKSKEVATPGKAQQQKQTQQAKTCPDCGKVFSRLSALAAHKRQHKKKTLKKDGENSSKQEDKTKSLTCTVCQKLFTRLYDVERHMETHVDSDRRKCTWCSKTFHTIKSKERHENLHCKQNKQNKCSTCDLVLSSKFKLLRHEREHLTSDQIKSLSCKICMKAFTNLRSLMRHERLHYREKGTLINCNHCPETFEDRFSYNAHLKTHDVRIYQCDLCGMKFKHEYLLKVHIKRMTCQKTRESLRDVQCSICQKTVKGTATLKRHMRTHTKEKPYPCRIGCNSSFSSTSNRLSHERMYCKLSPDYLCTHCGEVLSNQARLIYHESKYHGVGPLVRGQRISNAEYPCRHCGKVFFFKGGRKRHERIHLDEKPYMCQFCPKAFVHASALVCHERVHTKERPYICDECGKAFSQATHLKTHIRVHTKEKPYQCRFCDKAFSHMGTRKSHEGTHKNTREPQAQTSVHVPQEQVAAIQMTPQEHHVVIHPEMKVIHHETVGEEPVQHKIHVSHHEHEVQAADVILQLLESGSRVSNFEGLVHIASS
ncbi:zinc finger protein 271-like [Patiria miniata]|uniref:C2H2-type domain-containing protein n=1 Tax=Patiria miniata TaxID=46514 RepID=A0A913ZRS9_PATMI|nr:zinc finger protein 271-like [Patiria miniata]XP_038053865.1 zinc finger protein 271-like [Patiria miniata]